MGIFLWCSMADLSELTAFTAIAALEDAHRLAKQGLIIKTIKREVLVEYVVVKRAIHPPGKVLDWRPRKSGVL